MASKNPFAKTLGPPYSAKSGFKGEGVVNSSVTYESGKPSHAGGMPAPPGKGNMSGHGSMQSQIDAIKRRLAADVKDDQKADKAEPATDGKQSGINGIQGSGGDRGSRFKAKVGSAAGTIGGNVTPNQTSNGIG